MSKYKDIRGTHIKTVTADPPAPINGQMWYNSTTQVMKGFTSSPVGTWSTTAPLNTARYQLGGAGKLSTAALGFGGSPPPAPTAKAITEQWNGTSWTEVADLGTARYLLGGAGTSTAALAFGGLGGTGLSEAWDGSSWTEGPDLNTARSHLYGAGTSTAALAFGGNPKLTATEEYNGTAWSTKASLATGRHNLSGAGTTTAGIAFGGTIDNATNITEEFTNSVTARSVDVS